MRFLLFVVVGLLATNSRFSIAQESHEIYQYLANFEGYKSIEYSGVMLQVPDPKVQVESRLGLQVRRRFSVKYDFRNADYFLDQKVYIEGKDIWFRDLKSYVDGEERAYMDESSTALKDSGTSAMNGMIGPPIDRQELEGPEMLLGVHIARRYSKRLHLKDLVSNPLNPKVSGNANVTFEFSNVFRWKESFSGAIDLKVTLDKDHDFLPKEIEFIYFNRVKQKHSLEWKGTVMQFHRDPATSLWVPIDIVIERRGSEAVRYQVDPQSIVLNKCPPSADYKLEFPKGRIVDNLSTRQRTIDGVVIKELQVMPKPFDDILADRLKIGGVSFVVIGLAVALGVFLLRRSRGAFSVLLAFGMAMQIVFTGCNEKQTSLAVNVAKDAFLTNAAGESSLRIKEGKIRRVIVDLSQLGKKASFEFEIENVGAEVCVFDDFIHTTCGCTSARLSNPTVAPGEKIVLTGAIDSGTVPGERTVQVKVKLQKPESQEINFLVHATYTGDWVCMQQTVCFAGNLGSEASEVLEIQGMPKAIAGIEVLAPGLSLEEIPTKSPNKRSVRLKHKISSTVHENVVGEVQIKCSTASPAMGTIIVSEKGIPNGAWSPSTVVLKQDETKQVKLDISTESNVISIEELPGFKVSQVESGELETASVFEVRRVGELSDVRVVKLHAIIKHGESEERVPLNILLAK